MIDRRHLRILILSGLAAVAGILAMGLVWSMAGMSPIMEARPRFYLLLASVAIFVLALYVVLRRDIGREEKKRRQERERFDQYLDLADVILVSIEPGGRVGMINRKGAEILKLPKTEIVGENWFERFVPEPAAVTIRAGFTALLAGRTGPVVSRESPIRMPDGRERMIAWRDTILKDEEGKPVSILSSGEDVTARKRAEEQARYRLERLIALHSIDKMITSNLDLASTLEVILEQVVSQLGMDAADILLLNPHTQTLEYAAGLGFRSEEFSKTKMRLGEGCAGRAALNRTTIRYSNLPEAANEFVRGDLIQEEGFRVYHGVPLVAKGFVKGLLEVWGRKPIDPPPDWTKFLEALSSQAAIAVDNAALFNELQRANTELTIAYDATLEGWGVALELRDRETEGHTIRVTEMTLRLARAIGLSENEIVHIRRGAYLHDIGKIGIPDRILFKEAPLTEEEWEIMRQHPAHAFRLLKPIAYLRPAIDIPYCHHEKWDGTGYPRGLNGEQIPLAARIFAVVDVWDALVSTRPYHTAMPDEEVRERIRSLSGSHFDPEVVEVFLNMKW